MFNKTDTGITVKEVPMSDDEFFKEMAAYNLRHGINPGEKAPKKKAPLKKMDLYAELRVY